MKLLDTPSYFILLGLFMGSRAQEPPDVQQNIPGSNGPGSNGDGDQGAMADKLNQPMAGLTAPDVPVNWAGSTCDDKQKALVRREMTHAYDAARKTAEDVNYGKWYEHFFHANLRNGADFAATIKGRFERIAELTSGVSANGAMSVSCDPATTGCTTKGWYAHANPTTNVVNLCPKWFAADLDRSDNALAHCTDKDLRYFQRLKSSVLIHEMTHLPYSLGRQDSKGTEDVVYGYNGCRQLALGTFDRSCRAPGNGDPSVLCPRADDSTKEGLCPPSRSEDNADTYAFVAAGVYWSKNCNAIIKVPDSPVPAAPLARSKREAPRDLASSAPERRHGRHFIRDGEGCAPDDGIVWDGPDG